MATTPTMASAPTSRRERLWRAILLLGVGALLALMVAGAEALVRSRERHRRVPPDYFPSIFYPHQRLRYGLVPDLDYYGWFRINSHGFRGPEVAAAKRPGTVRIVCLGGSTTFDIGSVGPHRPWPEVLEAELRRGLATTRVEVLNLAVPGATSLDSLIDLQTRALRLAPNLVVVYQGHNDLIYSLPGPAGADDLLLPWEDRPRGWIKRWLTRNSLLYAKSQLRVARLWNGLARLVLRRPPEPPSAEARERAIGRGLDAFRDNLRSVAAICRAHGITLALPQLIVPRADGAALSGCRPCRQLPAAYGGLPAERIHAAFASYDHVLSELSARGQAWYVPTAGWVPSADGYYHDAVHFGPEGSRLMGRRLADALAPLVREALARGEPAASPGPPIAP